MYIYVRAHPSTNSQSLFSIISQVLLHFLFLYYTVSILKLLFLVDLKFYSGDTEGALAFHKSRLGKNLLVFLLYYTYENSKYYVY